jgi:hypothetical protein
MLSKKEPCVVHGLSVFLFFRELQKIRPPARKKNGGKLWARPPTIALSLSVESHCFRQGSADITSDAH